MKDTLEALKRVRNESKHIVDKSALESLDKIIQDIEDKISGKKKSFSTLTLLSYAARLLALIRFLSGDSPE